MLVREAKVARVEARPVLQIHGWREKVAEIVLELDFTNSKPDFNPNDRGSSH